MALTTVQLDVETRKQLAFFRDYPRETYDEIINKLMAITRKVLEEGELSEQALEDVRQANREYASGQGFSTRELLKRLEA